MALKMMAAGYGEPDQLRAYDVELPAPGSGEVAISVRAIGVNPTDYKTISGYRGRDPERLPLPIGREVAGVVSALGPDTELASGGGAVGDEVVAYRLQDGGYAEQVVAPA